ncbi:PAS domain S-box-containing protein [Thiohalorhabdus denitrificans]|uniref:histidine kinase n=1 Tax=Thiohalorhabdus denitrificans TaxID=381306 RepID=A0A1G5D704_9GAMM|nr:PAS domain S-box-containing protein [Thiohalorhabdus denitrificans]
MRAFLERVRAQEADAVQLRASPNEQEGHLEVQGVVLNLADGPWIHIRLREPTSQEHEELLLATRLGVDARRLLRHLLQYSKEGFLVADFQSLEILEVNASFCQMLGYERDSIIGTQVPSWLEQEDLAHFWKEAERRWEEESRYYEVRLVGADGNRVPVLMNVATCNNKLDRPALSVAFVTDLSQLKHSQELASYLLELLEAFPGVVGVCDDELHFFYNNRYAKELLGGDLSPDVGIWGIHPTWAAKNMLQEAIPTAAQKGSWVGKSALLDKHGHEVPFLVTLVAHKNLQRDIGRYSLVGIDLSNQEATEAQLRKYGEQLRSISRLISMEGLTSLLAHQLNQPLASLSNYAAAGHQLISRECPNADQMHDLMERIHQEIHKASEILIHVRRFLKGGEADFKPLDVNTLIARMRPFLEDSTHTERLTLELDLTEDPPPMVRADWLQLQEVLHNLINNARDANLERTPQAPPPVTVRTRVEDGEVVISIIDEGPGLPANMEHDGLVEPFFTTKEGGTGLGLWIAYTILEGHGGRLTAFNNPDGVGAIFQLRLPASKDSAS